MPMGMPRKTANMPPRRQSGPATVGAARFCLCRQSLRNVCCKLGAVSHCLEAPALGSQEGP
eukprot:CAMPEP_0113832540 /NCGR_PEP_ID=MMETSP0328-20130328/7433_1 /TAXON_ID=39455 /ORGANISM="Alexandrium minutum" /LENGTH=60 /DNA_ID=CAMNT_0000800759 /DNA_START=53 /DNA_END=231 /DNA_ORIENTATION=+ /assembly_acc=CAM_ASM_000350